VYTPGRAIQPAGPLEEKNMYQKPSVTRYGSLRELTLGGGAQMSGDATNLYHRS